MELPVNQCPLREGGGPKGRGWIRLAEAESTNQIHSIEITQIRRSSPW